MMEVYFYGCIYDIDMNANACWVLLMVIAVQRYAFFLKTPNVPSSFLLGG